MVPPVTDSRWYDLIQGRKSYNFHLLSLKIMMSRILLKAKQDPSPQNITLCIHEVHDFFLKNEKIGQKDLQQIFCEN